MSNDKAISIEELENHLKNETSISFDNAINVDIGNDRLIRCYKATYGSSKNLLILYCDKDTITNTILLERIDENGEIVNKNTNKKTYWHIV